jgi:hypothetical protein
MFGKDAGIGNLIAYCNCGNRESAMDSMAVFGSHSVPYSLTPKPYTLNNFKTQSISQKANYIIEHPIQIRDETSSAAREPQQD